MFAYYMHGNRFDCFSTMYIHQYNATCTYVVVSILVMTAQKAETGWIASYHRSYIVQEKKVIL